MTMRKHSSQRLFHTCSITVANRLSCSPHVRGVIDKLRQLNMSRDVRHYHYENFELGGPVIVMQRRLNQALAEIKGAAGGNEANREYAVDRLRVLIEGFVRELHLKRTGSPPPAAYDTANSGQSADLFRTIPGTDPAEHNGLKDSICFCDPAHHTQAGYSVPLKTNIQPHIDRVSGLLKKYGLSDALRRTVRRRDRWFSPARRRAAFA